MNKAIVGLLALVGVVGLICFLSFNMHGGNRVPGGPLHWTFSMGQPDPWLVWEQDETGFRTGINFLRWSMAAGIIGIACLLWSVRLGRWRSELTSEQTG